MFSCVLSVVNQQPESGKLSFCYNILVRKTITYEPNSWKTNYGEWFIAGDKMTCCGLKSLNVLDQIVLPTLNEITQVYLKFEIQCLQ